MKWEYGGTIEEAGQAIGKQGDEGIDGVIKEDVLGLDVLYIQAKKWDAIIASLLTTISIVVLPVVTLYLGKTFLLVLKMNLMIYWLMYIGQNLTFYTNIRI